jgi:chemotaxis family two-component system response regulator Rcp1
MDEATADNSQGADVHNLDAAPQRTSNEGQGYTMNLLHILLAEDNRGDVLLVREALQEHNIEHELFVVQDGAQAIEFIRRMGKPGEANCPDLMLLDLNLPKADGTEILSEFRRHPQCSGTPVIVVTSSDAPKDRARAAEFGIAHYFKKPSEFEEFMKLGAVVRETIDEKQL